MFNSQKQQIFQENGRENVTISAVLTLNAGNSTKNYTLLSFSNKFCFNFSDLREIFATNSSENASLSVKLEYLSQKVEKTFAISFKNVTETGNSLIEAQEISLENSYFSKKSLNFFAGAYFLDIFDDGNTVDVVFLDKNGGFLANFQEIAPKLRVSPPCMLKYKKKFDFCLISFEKIAKFKPKPRFSAFSTLLPREFR